MLVSLKKSFIFMTVASVLMTPSQGFCNIWNLTQDTISSNKTKITYEQVREHLRLLTADENIVSHPQQEDTLVIAGGYITLNPTSIRSFKNLEDYNTQDSVPEFEYSFEPSSSTPDTVATVSRKDLRGIRIAVDVIPTHPYFKDPIGDWSYEKFVAELQDHLGKSLSAEGAEISVLRPKIQLSAETVDEINQNPPHIVISTQFNNDNQDCMVTFCGGNTLKSDFANERQRARFIQAALTGKHVQSAGLGACITKHCQDKFNVKPLAWQNASFEGNARPVPASPALCSTAQLDQNGGNLNGIAMRNLIHNGCFAKAVVVPFPDMKWVREQVKPAHESEWIAHYTKAITDAVLDYAGKTPAVFE
jgi:hypothetical protein